MNFECSVPIVPNLWLLAPSFPIAKTKILSPNMLPKVMNKFLLLLMEQTCRNLHTLVDYSVRKDGEKYIHIKWRFIKECCTFADFLHDKISRPCLLQTGFSLYVHHRFNQHHGLCLL